MDLRYIARPYAKAVFSLALESQALPFWSTWLANAALLTKQAEIIQLIANPEVSKAALLTLFTDILNLEKNSPTVNFLSVLIENKRLVALPFISEQFAKLYAEYEKQVDAEVISAEELSSAQCEKLIAALEKRLRRKVNLRSQVNKEILGGAIIRIDDLVIDGSGRGRLNQLSEHLKGKILCN